MTAPQVLLTNFEAVRILAGNALTCSDLDGNPVIIRLATADEMLASSHKARALLFPDGGGPAPMTWAQADRLTTPIGAGAS